MTAAEKHFLDDFFDQACMWRLMEIIFQKFINIIEWKCWRVSVESSESLRWPLSDSENFVCASYKVAYNNKVATIASYL